MLWKYQDSYSRLERVTNTLPKDTAAIEMRSDGLLVGINGQVSATTARETQPLEQARVFIYDPADGRIVYETAIPSGRHYPSFSALAWPGACGNASKGGPADIIKAVTVEPTEACPGVDFNW